MSSFTSQHENELIAKGWIKEPDGSITAPRKRGVANVDPLPIAEPEPIVRKLPEKSVAGKEESSRRLRVNIESRRKRLLDTDNVVPKFIIDCLRYAGAIPDDSTREIELSVSQTKVSENECTVVIVSD